MPVVIFYKDGDIGLLHYNVSCHERCIEAIKNVKDKEIDKIVLYTCQEREKIPLVKKQFENFCSELEIENYNINTSSAKSTKNLACVCAKYNYEKFTITNNDEHSASLEFVDKAAEQSNKEIYENEIGSKREKY